MRSVLLFLSAAAALSAQPVRVAVDARVELMSIVFRLAGSPEYNQCRVPAYGQAIDRYFAPCRDHEAVRLARELGQQPNSVSYDAVMNMAVQLTDVRSLSERIPFDSPKSRLDARWRGVKARPFLAALRRFVADSKFENFLASQQALYETTGARLQAFAATLADIAWFDRFFGVRNRPRFFIIPGVANGGSSYGASLTAEDGTEEVYAIPGAFQVDSSGAPVFAAADLEVMVHEFVHSYTNPVVDQFAAQMEKPAAAIFSTVADTMRMQAYGEWKIMLYESLVRASTARYVLEHDGIEAAFQRVREDQWRTFYWTGELVDLLGRYERERDRYPTLAAFMPEVARYFEGLAPRVDRLERRIDALRPAIASMSVANGAAEVDSALEQIVIRFDRPMQNSWSFAKAKSDLFPKIGKLRFDDTGTVLTMAVTLEPGREYEFVVNLPDGHFRARDGAALLKPVLVHFATAKAR